MELLMPVIIAAVVLAAVVKRVDLPKTFAEGARENLITAFELCPTLILLMTAVEMFVDSGVAERLAQIMSPLIGRIGFPAECLPLALIRPVSGSGALSVLDRLLADIPPDSFPARTAAVMMGATETTLYTIAVYCGASGRKPSPRLFICSFAADLTGFIFAPIFARLM